MGFLTYLREIIENFENSQIRFIYFPLTFFFVTTLRNFLEVFAYDPTALSYEYFFHYYLFYISLALALIIFFHFVTDEKIKKVSKVILTSFSITILPPIFDLIHGSFRLTYILPGYHGDLLSRFLYLGGSFTKFGITLGVRIEMGIVIALCFIYFLIKRVGLIKSIISSFFLYTLFFAYGIIPHIVKALLNLFGIRYTYSPFLMIDFNLFCILILLVIFFYIESDTSLRKILDKIPLFRLTHFELMFILGIALGTSSFLSTILTLENIFDFFFVMVSIFFGGLFSLMLNNMEDGDKNANSRTVKSLRIPYLDNRETMAITLVLSILYAIAVDFRTLFIVVLGIGNYFIYSAPPLRLKRIPLLSKLIISFNSLITIVLGFTFSGVRLVDLPFKIILFFLVFYTLAINFIDLKDFKEDKKDKIMTLPVIFGLKKSKIVIGLFFFLAYITAPIAFSRPYIFPLSFLLGSLELMFIIKENYVEKYVFYIYLPSILFLILILI